MQDAVRALVDARRTGQRIAALPPGSAPGTIEQGHEIQDATTAALNERVAGWKVSITPDGVMRGIILASRLVQSPATLPARDLHPLGIEVEIAFLFNQNLPPRAADYTTKEVAAAVTAVVGIEIVSSRFTDYRTAPLMERTADCMSNGAFVVGTRRPDWRRMDLSKLEAILCVNGQETVRKIGAHTAGDPILPAIALVNLLRRSTGVRAGQLITTGTFTGLHFAAPGDSISGEFTNFGKAELTLENA